jgi:hypothetical protein
MYIVGTALDRAGLLINIASVKCRLITVDSVKYTLITIAPDKLGDAKVKSLLLPGIESWSSRL